MGISPANDGMVRSAHSSTGEAAWRRGRDTFASGSFSLVADRLNVVAVEIEHKCAIIALVIVGPETRRAVIPATRPQGQPVEFRDLRAALRGECNVDARPRRTAVAEPEKRRAPGP